MVSLYTHGMTAALIKLGVVVPWTPEELQAQQAQFRQRLEKLPDIPENIRSPEFQAHAQRMARSAQIGVEGVPLSAPGTKHLGRLNLAGMTPLRTTADLGPTLAGPWAAEGRTSASPLRAAASAATPVRSGETAMARLKRLLRLAPKG